jgi:alpha-N-arabinofuranosidase
VLRARVECDTYGATYYDPRGPQDLYFPIPAAPYLKLAAVANESGGGLTLFALNRDLEQAMELAVEARGFSGLRLAEAWQLRDDDLAAVNTKEAPDRVRPTKLEAGASAAFDGDRLRLNLAPASWNVVSFAPAA